MGETVVVLPGQPADIETSVAKPPIPYPTIIQPARPKLGWSPAFSVPAWRPTPKPIYDILRLSAILTLRNQRGEIVATHPVDISFVPSQGDVVDFYHVLDQYTVDILAVSLACQSTPGTWDLQWDDGAKILRRPARFSPAFTSPAWRPRPVTNIGDPHIDNGPLVSAITCGHRTKIPSGCTPCGTARKEPTP